MRPLSLSTLNSNPCLILPNFSYKISAPTSHKMGQRTRYGLDKGEIVVRFPTAVIDLSLLQTAQTNYGTHPASYLICTRSRS
jgi:hypothetical protein